MVMRVWWLIDRLRPLTAPFIAVLVVTGLAGGGFNASAQQDPPKRQQQQQTKPPAKKPPASSMSDKPATPKKPSFASRTEGLPPSQVGIGTLAQFAFMVDPQTSTVLLFKD